MDQAIQGFPNLDLDDEAKAEDELAKLADELGAMQKQLAKAKEVVNKHDALRKRLEALSCEGRQGKEEVIVRGEKSTVVFSPASNVRELTSKAKLFKFLGNEDFVALANFKISDLEDYLTKAQREQCMTTHKHAGSRRVKVVTR